MISAKVIKLESNTCNLCLSSSRILKPLGNYSTVFMSIMHEKSSFISDMDLLSTYICWECEAFLDKVIQFQDKVIQLQLNLTEINDMNQKSLSTLNHVYLPNINYTQTEDEQVNKFTVYYDSIQSIFNKFKTKNNTQNSVDIKMDEDIPNFDLDVNKNDDNKLIKNDKEYLMNSMDIKDNEEELNCYDYETDEDYQNSELPTDLEVKVEIKKKKRKEHIKVGDRFTVRHMIPYNETNCPKLILSKDQIEVYRNKLREQSDFINSTYKCDLCILGWKTKKKLESHNKKYHLKSIGKIECRFCERRFTEKYHYASHINSHFFIFHCKLCSIYINSKKEARQHFDEKHAKVFVCNLCNLSLPNYYDWLKHYNQYHSFFICDYCGSKYRQRNGLINHISIKHNPYKNKCTICNKEYSRSSQANTHKRLYHTVAESPSYCVECNMTFVNEFLYKRHLKVSVKHSKPRKDSFPCPVCNKVYARHTNMKYHYRHVHEAQSKFKCLQCDRFFLNGYRLRQHTASIHDKIPAARNKICSICGKAFQSNRVLDNHVRTHTGERPFQCAHCPAAFTQKCAMVVHTRKIHGSKLMII